MALTDADLVRRVTGGERTAYAVLVQRYQRMLYRYMRGMGLDHETALDLLQDAFVKAYVRLQDCAHPEHFRAWLFRIGRNLCLDYRKDVRRRMTPLSSLPEAKRIPACEPGQDETRRILSDALTQLPLPLREAFLLKHDAGHTYEEISEITAASLSAVKMRVHRAREALREFLTAHGVKGIGK